MSDTADDNRTTSHASCADYLRRAANSPENPMHGLRGVMVVSESRPAITVPEFPPHAARCPHGFVFWTYPDGARVAALRDLNYPAQGGRTPPAQDGAR